MNEILAIELAVLAALTPLVLAAIGWARRLSKQLADLTIMIVGNSARQDATLADHERRLVDLEHPNR
jgi:hypothetical protein|tara:strand:+ start:1284 stop:1484 length:201 start_codon:yes stop_codon:yes gene_type:complete